MRAWCSVGHKAPFISMLPTPQISLIEGLFPCALSSEPSIKVDAGPWSIHSRCFFSQVGDSWEVEDHTATESSFRVSHPSWQPMVIKMVLLPYRKALTLTGKATSVPKDREKIAKTHLWQNGNQPKPATTELTYWQLKWVDFMNQKPFRTLLNQAVWEYSRELQLFPWLNT